MLTDAVDFLSDIQSINPTKRTGFVLFCATQKEAHSIQHQLLNDFDIPCVLDIDNYGAHYIVPLEDLDYKTTDDFIRRGWSWDRNQNFYQYLITLYNEDSANKIYNIMIAHGYNVTLSPNKMQLVVNCVTDSPRNTAITELKCKLDTFEKTSPKSMDDYFNKILFNGVIENTEYHKTKEQKFDIDTIKQNKDFLIREILYWYFDKRIRPRLNWAMFPKKFDANKLNNKTLQNVILIRDFLYSVAEKYVDDTTKENQQPVIRFDYLKTLHEYDNFKDILDIAKKWQRTNIKNARIEKRNARISQRQTYKIMDLNDGYYIVHLGGQEALNYENRTLKHPVAIYYIEDIYEGFARYSIRRGYAPVLTLEVYKGKVIQCYGYNNEIPCNNELRKAVRTFMDEYDLSIPNNSWNQLIARKRQDGTDHDVLNFQKYFVLNDTLDLEGMNLDKIPEMSTVTINGHLLLRKNNLSDFTGAPAKVLGNLDATQNPIDSLYGIPREIGGWILLFNHNLNETSFVPMYIEPKLDDIIGVDKTIIDAWREQITRRKTCLANIISAVRESKK